MFGLNFQLLIFQKEKCEFNKKLMSVKTLCHLNQFFYNQFNNYVLVMKLYLD